MSHSVDLCEYSRKTLEDELKRRKHLRELGVCDYCGRSPESPLCMFPGRHKGEKGE